MKGRYSPASPTNRGLPLHNWRQCLLGQQIPWRRSKASRKSWQTWRSASRHSVADYCFPLFFNDDFIDSINGSTNDKSKILKRIKIVKGVLK